MKEKFAYISLGILFIINVIFVGFNLPGYTYLTYINPMFTLYFGIILIKRIGIDSHQGKSMLFVLISMTLWFIGDILWVIYQEAVVSIADISWLLGYPIFLTAYILGYKTLDENFMKNKKNIIVIFLITIIIIVGYFKFFPISWDNEISFIENIVTSGYVVADLFLLLGVFALIYAFIQGSFSTVWILIGLGTLSWFIGDIYYAINYETYVEGQIIDLSWNFAYLFITAAFIFLNQKTKNIFNLVKN